MRQLVGAETTPQILLDTDLRLVRRLGGVRIPVSMNRVLKELIGAEFGWESRFGLQQFPATNAQQAGGPLVDAVLT